MYYIPCAISVLRALAVIPLFVLFPQYPVAALVVFITAAASDALDGFLARKLRAESTLGEIIDPIADKILYLGSLMALWNAAPTLWLLIIPTLALEAPLAAIRFIKPYCDRRAANPYGKIKTTAQFCAISCMMLGVMSGVQTLVALGLALGIIAVPLAWMSFYTHIYSNKTAAS